MKNKKILLSIIISTVFFLMACTKKGDNSIEPTDTKDNESQTEMSENVDENLINDEQSDAKIEIENTEAKNTEIENIEVEDSETQEVFEPVNLNNTYCTRYEIVNAVTCPTFQFDYTDNWKITEEIIDDHFIDEKDVISNDRDNNFIYRFFKYR